MRRALRRRLLFVPLGLAVLAAAGCIHYFTTITVRPLDPPTGERVDSIKTSIKVHLIDGTTVNFPSGAQVSRTRIFGSGMSFPLLSDAGVMRSEVPMDSVVGVEVFGSRTLGAKTAIVSLSATALGAIAFVGLMVAIFGSCPTLYANVAGAAVLEAEGFSYAIAPLMEHRDVDALRLRPDAEGVIRLELRNEALETHFINHVELLSVRHAAGERVVPDQAGRPVALSGFGTLAGATDRAGRDVRPLLAKHDAELFGTASATVDAAREGDLDDWIDLDLADLPAGDSIAVLLRMRNSLLNTVLLYEGMLGGRDAPDWLDSGLQHIGNTVELSRWYSRTMGMHVTIEGAAGADGLPLGALRVGDVGPIAFRDVAVILPRPATDAPRARVRLRFVADNWRIDEVRVAGRVTRPAVTILPVDSIIVPVPARGDGPIFDRDAVRAVAEADEVYLETRPGQRMTIVFRSIGTGATSADSSSTELVAWQGWYREWIRGSWLANPSRETPFIPGDAAILTALRSWSAQKSTFEHAFYSSAIPVR